MSFKQPPLETQDNRQFEDYRVKKHYSSSADVLEATGFSVDFLKSIGNLTDNQVESLISNYISRADERIRRMLGIPVTVRKEGHEFFNNPVVQLGPEREDPFEFFGAYNPTNRVVEVYAIYYNNYRTKIPYPKDWDQFTEDTTGWGTENGTIAKDTSDFKCGTASLKATITGSQGGSIYYPSTKNLHKRIYPWFYAGFWFKTDNKDALFDFRIVRDTGSYYHNTFKVSNEDTWETVQLSIRRFQFVNVGGEGEQAPFNWILIYTEWFQIVADRPCNFWIDNFSFNDGFFATYPSGEICWNMPEWFPTGRITVTYSYDPFLDSVPPALEEASSKLAGVLLFDWVIGKRQMAIAFSQLSDSLAEVPDRETLENTRRRLETEAMAALESLGFRTWEGLA